VTETDADGGKKKGLHDDHARAIELIATALAYL
jgi:hypothetical protein